MRPTQLSRGLLEPVSFPYGSAHISENQYLFGLPTAPHPGTLNESQQALAANMKRCWTTFADRGRPSAKGQPRWPRYKSSGQRMLSLAPPLPHVRTDFAADHHCDFWTGIR